MDDSWRAKCGGFGGSSFSSSSSWSLPPPLVPLVAAPSALPTVPVLAQGMTGSVGQVQMNSRQHLNGFYVQDALLKSVSEAISKDQYLVQEKLSFSSVNSDFSKPGKMDSGSPFFTLLSGNLSQLPTSRVALAKSHHNKDENVQSVAFSGLPVTTLPTLLHSHQNNSEGNWNALTSIATARPYKSSGSAKTPVDPKAFHAVVSSKDAGVDKVACKQTSRVQTGNAESISWHQGPTLSVAGNSRNQHNLSVQNMQENPFRPNPFFSRSSSSLLKGHPRVFCRNTVGHLFMDNNGLIGVICFCHSFPMSVAKFCEHSGVSSANPADVVILENGMTILQWSKQCLGVLAPGSNWHWSQDSSVNGDLLSTKIFSGPTLLNKMGPPSNPKVSDESWRSREPLPFSSHGSTVPGQSNPDKLANKELASRYERDNLSGHNLFTDNFSLPTQVSMPLANASNTLQAVIEPPVSVHCEDVYSTVLKGKDVLGQNSNANYVGCAWNAAMLSNSTARSASLPKKDSGPSNVELRLGQPCQNSYTFAGYPESMLQFGAPCSSQKPQFHKPLNARIDKAKVAPKSRANFPVTPLEASVSKGVDLKSSVKTVDVVNTSESSEVKNDTMKNSLISLFLSHLEGNQSTHSLDNVFNNEDSLTRMPTDETFPIKTKISRSLDVTGDFTVRSNANIFDLSKNTSDKKNSEPVDSIGVESNYVAIIDHVAKMKNLASSISINCSTGSSFVDHNCQSSLSEQTPNILKKPYSWSSSGFGVHLDHVVYNSESRAPNVIGQPSTLDSNTLICSSATTICPLEPISSWSHFKASHDETVKVSPPNHTIGLYKQEKSIDTLEANLANRRLHCHPSVQFQPSVCSNDLALHMELREGSCCINHQDFSKLATRAFSCCSGCGADGLAGQPNQIGSSKCCHCSSSIRVQLDSQSDEHKDSACKTCSSHWQPRLIVGRGSNNCMADGHMHDTCNQSEQNSCFSDKCCSMRNCVPACCVSGGNVTANASKKQMIQGQSKVKYLSSDYVRDYSAPELKRIRLAHCNCLNNVSPKNNNQTVYWRDVPEKACAQSSGIDKLAKAFGTSKVSVDQPADAAGSQCCKSDQESQSVGAELTCHGSTESSVPVVTEVSLETKNMNTCRVNIGIASSNCDFVVDEGSEIEKCGSSDEAASGSQENPTKSTSTCLHSCSSGNNIDELHPRNPAILKRAKFQGGNCTGQENTTKKQKTDRLPSTWNRTENPGDKRIPESDFSTINLELHDSISIDSLKICPSLEKREEVSGEQDNMKKCLALCPPGTVKRKRSALPATKSSFSKKIDNQQKFLHDYDMQPRDSGCSLKRVELSYEMRMQDSVAESKLKMIEDAEKPPKYMSLNSILNTSSHKRTSFTKKSMPIVCGNSGIIYNEKTLCQQKPVKMVSLKLILENANGNSSNILVRQRMAKLPKSETACQVTNKAKGSCSRKRLSSNKQSCSMSEIGENPRIFKSPCRTDGPRNYGKFVEIATLNRTLESHLQSEKSVPKTSSSSTHTQLEGSSCLGEKDLYSKENACIEDKDPKENTCLSTDSTDRPLDSSETVENQQGQIHIKESLLCPYPKHVMPDINDDGNHNNAGNLSVMSKERYAEEEKSRCLEPNTSCCVCGSINQDIRNKMIECSVCFIRVHQACYGVPKVPKGVWQCRPCKTNSQNTVCVLCGYEGGAMTRALKTQNIVQSLLRVWKVTIKSSTAKQVPASETLTEETQKWSSIEASEYKKSGLNPVVDLINSDLINSKHPRLAMKMELKNQAIVTKSRQGAVGNLHACNSIIAGLFDPSILQWVHMVCGLWTPGTRCPNNNTMSAFDVSGASPAKRNAICSVCNRAGGSYIKCRVQTCSTQFHPWCAHQKGLLQSEIEGDDKDKVGFYSSCVHHATANIGAPCDSHVVNLEECKDWTCARSEGFEGRKREKKCLPGTKKSSSGGCIVSQEQRNAWLHINRPKSYKIGGVKKSSSDVEHDFRKEYARYKQLKAWKHLIVYKSGIHALGLYTSQFISRGAMVVEYVGEIVGLRVADKREIEYQSGRRIQYKSACYFFRIDKEHIIDATRKGGIARFVNHSCLPNCVAKIISIKNEKKVVFFAERDINPGEEITYDYHFNREDEGEKIPCFCNSNNCRQFLN